MILRVLTFSRCVLYMFKYFTSLFDTTNKDTFILSLENGFHFIASYKPEQSLCTTKLNHGVSFYVFEVGIKYRKN